MRLLLYSFKRQANRSKDIKQLAEGLKGGGAQTWTQAILFPRSYSQLLFKIASKWIKRNGNVDFSDYKSKIYLLEKIKSKRFKQKENHLPTIIFSLLQSIPLWDGMATYFINPMLMGFCHTAFLSFIFLYLSFFVVVTLSMLTYHIAFQSPIYVLMILPELEFLSQK